MTSSRRDSGSLEPWASGHWTIAVDDYGFFEGRGNRWPRSALIEDAGASPIGDSVALIHGNQSKFRYCPAKPPSIRAEEVNSVTLRVLETSSAGRI